jgi:hypothetical protein
VQRHFAPSVACSRDSSQNFKFTGDALRVGHFDRARDLKQNGVSLIKIGQGNQKLQQF